MNFITSKRFVTIALALLVAFNVTLLGVLLWQNTHRLAPWAPNRQHERQNSFIEPLTLSESQKLCFRKLRQEHFLKVMPEMEKITLLKKQLVEESLKDQPDIKKIDTLALGIGSYQATIEHELALHFHELAKICTPEQRDSLKKVLDGIVTHKHSMRMERSKEHRP